MTEGTWTARWLFRHSGLVILSDFVICHSSFFTVRHFPATTCSKAPGAATGLQQPAGAKAIAAARARRQKDASHLIRFLPRYRKAGVFVSHDFNIIHLIFKT